MEEKEEEEVAQTATQAKLTKESLRTEARSAAWTNCWDVWDMKKISYKDGESQSEDFTP